MQELTNQVRACIEDDELETGLKILEGVFHGNYTRAQVAMEAIQKQVLDDFNDSEILNAWICSFKKDHNYQTFHPLPSPFQIQRSTMTLQKVFDEILPT